MIRLDLLPGKDGDSLLLRYGDGEHSRRVLIDGGRASSYPLVRPVLAGLDGPLDLLVVTHVDQDHVLGVLALLRDPEHVPVSQVWFNGYDHLNDVGLETFGARDGELLTTALLEQGIPWNTAFDGRAVEVGRDPAGFGGEAVFTVLSPDRAQLEALIPLWEKECAAHGLVPGRAPVPPAPPEGFESLGRVDVEALALTPLSPDPSRANATSIGFLFESEGVRIVFTGDGDDARLVQSLRPLAEAEGGRLRVDALKVAHHGSAGNLSRELLELLDCPRYLICTNGARHGHPDDVAMARILKFGGAGKELVFNYAARAALWDDPQWRQDYGYTVVRPDGPDGFVSLSWSPG